MAKKKLGILLSTPPEHNNLKTVVSLTHEAIKQGVDTYLYLIDDGVHNLGHPEMDRLIKTGVNLFVCAYGAQRRGMAPNESAVFSGMVVLSDLVKGCDRFLSFT